ncbi:MAG: hypothetical protein IIB95_04795 [Candidatus Marinimicrobia bacterium]|nr:hypothetical protein [Candidatus Neomarinimicrobiota bacterium]
MKKITLLIFSIMMIGLISCLDEELPELFNPYEEIDGPAILMNPLEIYTKVGENFSINLRLEEVLSFMGVYAELGYDTDVLVFNDYELIESDSSLLVSFSGEVFSFIEDDSDAGLIKVSLSVAAGSIDSIASAGDLVQFNFTAKQKQETEIAFTNECRLTDSNMDEIPIVNLYNGVIYVE